MTAVALRGGASSGCFLSVDSLAQTQPAFVTVDTLDWHWYYLLEMGNVWNTRYEKAWSLWLGGLVFSVTCFLMASGVARGQGLAPLGLPDAAVGLGGNGVFGSMAFLKDKWGIG